MTEWDRIANVPVVEDEGSPVVIVQARGRQQGDRVPNQFPAVEPSGSARIAVVGEAPGEDEDWQGFPFAGQSGRILDDTLGKVGIARTQVFVGNVCQVRPNKENSFDALDWQDERVQSGIRQLREDLKVFRPSIVFCLGNAALHLFKNGNVAPPRKGRMNDWPDKIGMWRGSLFESALLAHEKAFICPDCKTYDDNETFCGKCGAVTVPVNFPRSGQPDSCSQEQAGHLSPWIKCLATYHPAAMARDYSIQGYYYARRGLGDFVRLREEAGSAAFVLPKRELAVADTEQKLEWSLRHLEAWAANEKPLSHDIEGGPGNITALSFARSSEFGVCIPLAHADGTSLWPEEIEIMIWERVKPVLESSCTKIGTNFGYDAMALAWTYGIVVGGEVYDTMESAWELWAELRKGLAAQASLLTRESFYKPDKEEGELVFESDRQFWEYSARDAAVTFECWEKAMGLLLPMQREHLRSNSKLFPWKLYAMLRGFRVDEERVKEKKEEARLGVWKMQEEIDGEARDSAWRNFYDVMLTGREDLFSVICAACLCGKAPKEKRAVTEERWQPMRWNGKKWVKEGKLIYKEWDAPVQPFSMGFEPPLFAGPEDAQAWLKPMHKQVEKSFALVPTRLKDLEEHVLDSKASEWRRVKQIWKELKSYELSKEDAGSVAGRVERDCEGASSGDGQVRSETATAKTEKALVHSNDGPVDKNPAPLLGELAFLLGLSINVGSNEEGGDTQKFLFQTCGLPGVFINQKGQLSREAEAAWKKRVKGAGHAQEEGIIDGSNESGQAPRAGAGVLAIPAPKAPLGKRVTTKQEALDKLYAETRDERALWVLQQRRLRKIVADLSSELDHDGRLRFSLSFVLKTGRMAASESSLGTGTNPMALNKDLRSICVADEGCEMGQVDFEGSDSWTVACECAALGETAMLEDLRAGLKPAKVMCKIDTEGPRVNLMSREQIADELEKNPPAKWLYAAHKSGHHGYDYGMGANTLIMTVLKYSMADLPADLSKAKPVVLSKAQAERILAANASRYPGVKRWQEKEGRDMVEKGMIVFPTGHVRYFYGRKARIAKGVKGPDHETLKQWLASKPQYWTTKMIKVALTRLWEDPENRNEDGSLKVEALIAVHDSLVLQWRKELREWARTKIRQWFDNPVVIAGQRVVIPFDGTIGEDWGMEGAEVEGL